MIKNINEVIYEDEYEIIRLIDSNTVGITFKGFYTNQEEKITLSQYIDYYSGDKRYNNEVKERINKLLAT